MTVYELEKITTLYKVSKILGVSPPSVYKWKTKGKIPALRLYQLREKKPEWFANKPVQ